MLIETKDFKEICSKLLTAVDNNELSIITETLELLVENNYLYLNVTNKEYFAQVKIKIQEEETFHATVNANLFLKLISQITTEHIKFSIQDNYLYVIGNGNYELPLIFNGDSLLELPQIKINNVTNTFNIDSNILKSILQYNSKELSKGVDSISKPVQKLYYLDEQGAITFTANSACINNFKLEAPIKLLLNNRLVKLFKLFDDETIEFTLGYDDIGNDIIQPKVQFKTNDIVLTAILPGDESLLTSVPVEAIRGRANAAYTYGINIARDALIQTLNRLMLFSTVGNKEDNKLYSVFEFNKSSMVVYDTKKTNKEEIQYNNELEEMEEPYIATLDLMDLKNTLENCNESYLTMYFGDHTAIIISRGNVRNVISECHLKR